MCARAGVKWKHCARCAAAFYLCGGVPGDAGHMEIGGSSSSAAAASAPPVAQSPTSSAASLVAALTDLARLHASGALNVEELQEAKRKMLQ